MTIVMGLWIDHREATLVTLDGEAEAIQHIASGVDKHVRFAGEAAQTTAEDMRDRRFANQLSQFFDAVSTAVRAADSILIMGPGEAKGELAKHLEAENRPGRIVGIETVDKMTERQIAARVRQHFLR